jgi:membrane protein DedA with SNARE-associated domain
LFDFVTRIIDSAGYAGIVLLMFLENIFPPVPSEMIMPMAGYVAASGKLTLVGVVLSGSLGSLLGALAWYFVGRALGAERLQRWAGKHGRWLTLTPAGVERVNQWFATHCGKAVFFGRLVPAVRTLISVPAGIFEMSLRRFAAYTALGSAIWSAALASTGYLLRDGYEQVGHYLNPVANVIVALIVLTYLYRLITWRPTV